MSEQQDYFQSNYVRIQAAQTLLQMNLTATIQEEIVKELMKILRNEE